MSTFTINLTPHLHTYLLQHSVREHEVLKKLRETTQEMSTARMQISPEQGQFMGLLLEILNARKTLDIGTFTGYSALVAALALPEHGKVIALDINDEWTRIARKFWRKAGVDHKIDLMLAPAKESLAELIDAGESNTFDFAFIDADKANYDSYYESALELVKSGGIIGIDNVLWSGQVADSTVNDQQTRSIRALNEKIAKDERVSIAMIPIGDGLTLARKR